MRVATWEGGAIAQVVIMPPRGFGGMHEAAGRLSGTDNYMLDDT